MSEAGNNTITQNMPLVTIVTPAYNQAQFLEETINSVLAQDYPAIEYIVLDDGSTDTTAEILRRFDGRITWESQPNMGQAATLNKGWAMARGEIIAYLSSDDLLKPDAVSEAVKALQASPELIMVYPDYELIDSSGQHIRNISAPEFDHDDMITRLVCQPGPGAFFYKRDFDAVGGWDAQLRQIPDYEFWLRMSDRGLFGRLPKVLALSRVHEGSQTFNVVSEQRAMEPITVLDRYYAERASVIPAAQAKQARANARLVSARMFFRSGNPMRGLALTVQAITCQPALLFSVRVWRLLASGLAGKFIYRFLFKTGNH